MADLPELTESDVRNWTDTGSYRRGTGYYEQGRIINPRLQGRTLKASCIGSAPSPYAVEITLDDTGISTGHCSCPVGGGGHCKHAVALLLTWIDDPEAFREVKETQSVLEGRSKAELIELIERMLDRHPDLEALLELPIVVANEEMPQLNVAAIARQAASAFYGADPNDWRAAGAAGAELEQLVNIGDAYAGRERWDDAAQVYRVVIETTLARYEEVDDEEGALNEVVNRCVSGLGACLEATADPARREGLLRALFDVYRWDIDFGGIDMGYESMDLLLERTSAEEKARVAGWVREAMPSRSTWSTNWGREAYGGFLLDLEAEVLDDEAYLRICRETGRLVDLVNRLLELGRVEAAADEVRNASDYDLLQAVDVFVAHERGDLAEQLVRERMPHSQDGRLPGWLKERAVAQGNLAVALRLAELLFWRMPSMEGYQEMKGLAGALHTWPELRDTILTRLNTEEQYALLTSIHVAEGEVDAALASLELAQQKGGWQVRSLSIQVARAAEEARPEAAIGLYMQHVEVLIRARGRGSYAQAAGYLQRVRAMLVRLGAGEEWTRLIAALRDHHRRLRALQDELNKAGL